MEMETPWGASQSASVIAEGITVHSTASHGGIELSESRIAALPDGLQEFKPWAGRGWYEEDCDYGVVVLAFPSSFGCQSAYYARSALRREYLSAKVGSAYYQTSQWAEINRMADMYEATLGEKYEIGCEGSAAGGGWWFDATACTGGDRIRVIGPRAFSLPTHFTLVEVAAAGLKVVRQ